MTTKQQSIIESLFTNGAQTRKSLPGNVANESLYRMEQAGIITRHKATIKHGSPDAPGRGRPQTVWTLTKKQKDRLRRAQKASA